jgi:hypothetical protein
MVTRFSQSSRKQYRRGMLITELVVAMSILTLAMLPLAFSIAREQRLTRAYYHRAIVTEIIDGEMEALVAGEWRAFQPGTQRYPVRAGAARNLPSGQFLLTLDARRLRLEWSPAQPLRSGRVFREAMVK